MSKETTPTQDDIQSQATTPEDEPLSTATNATDATDAANAEQTAQAAHTTPPADAEQAPTQAAANDAPAAAKAPDAIDNGAQPEAKPAATQPEGVATPDADLAAVQAHIAELEKQAQINLEGWQRARAEFANYKRRIDRDAKVMRERAATDVLTDVLPIIDDFELALQNVPEDLQGNPWVGGTASILKSFEKLLQKYNVETIDPVGQRFDPRLHEAIGMDSSSEYASEHVTATLRKGYISGDYLLRPALVRVAS
jgi:molecular chaperone GrpE